MSKTHTVLWIIIAVIVNIIVTGTRNVEPLPRSNRVRGRLQEHFKRYHLLDRLRFVPRRPSHSCTDTISLTWVNFFSPCQEKNKKRERKKYGKHSQNITLFKSPLFRIYNNFMNLACLFASPNYSTFLFEVTTAIFSSELRNVVFGELVERLVERRLRDSFFRRHSVRILLR